MTDIDENYVISSTGRVRSLDRLDCKGRFVKGKLLSSKTNTHKYESVLINGKRFYVHRLVAMAFIPNPNEYPQINHKNGNKKDNSVENLEWCTQKQNNEHAWRTGLSKGYERTQDYKKQVSETVKNLWTQGVFRIRKSEDWTPEQRKRARLAQLNSPNKRRGANAPQARKIQCVETGEVFGCIKDADRKYGKKAVKLYFNKKQKTAYGWHWKYI